MLNLERFSIKLADTLSVENNRSEILHDNIGNYDCSCALVGTTTASAQLQSWLVGLYMVDSFEGFYFM